MYFQWAFFDVDGTLTTTPSVWEFLHRQLDLWESEGKKNLQDFLEKRTDYHEFARRDAMGYKGLHRSELNRILDQIEIRPGIAECFSFLRNEGIRIGLISTGLDILVNRFFPVDFAISNELVFRDNVCTGEVIVHLPIDAKERYIKQFLFDRNVDAVNTITVGDSLGDIGMMRLSGLRIAMYPCHSELLDVCHVCLMENGFKWLPDVIQRQIKIKMAASRSTFLVR